MAKKRRTPIKAQIEKTPGLLKKELFWTKVRGKDLEKVKAYGREGMVISRDSSCPESDFVIHHHILIDKSVAKFLGGLVTWTTTYSRFAMPSLRDIKNLRRLMRLKKVKVGVIAVVDKKGKVIGYTFFKLRKSLTPKADFGSEKYQKIIEKKLKRWGLTLKIRGVSMPGYRFDKRKGDFEKILK